MFEIDRIPANIVVKNLLMSLLESSEAPSPVVRLMR